MLGRREVSELEPHLDARSAILSETSGVIDPMGLMRSFASVAQSAGAEFAFSHEVTAVERIAGGFVLSAAGPDGSRNTISAGGRGERGRPRR